MDLSPFISIGLVHFAGYVLDLVLLELAMFQGLTMATAIKKVFRKYTANLQEYTYTEIWFQQRGVGTLLKWNFGTGVLLLIFCIFLEHIFYHATQYSNKMLTGIGSVELQT